MATPIPKQVLDTILREQIALGRFANQQVSDIISLLNQADKDILAKISAADPSTFSARRLNALLKQIRTAIEESYAEARAKLTDSMEGLAEHQAESTAALLSTQVPVSWSIVGATKDQLAAIVSKEPITVGPDSKLLLEEIFNGLVEGKEEAIRGAIRLGMVEGETVPQMVRRLQGSRASRYTDGIFEKQRRHAEAIVRTVVNHTSNRATQLTYQANANVVKGWVFMATLDSRTTITCSSLSGTKWKIDEGPLPPRHVRCRSFSAPDIKTWRELGADLDEFPASYRSSMNGPVKADISFDEWLRGQPVDVQKDILGTTRQKMFAEGKLPLSSFTDDKGRVLSLEQLKEKHREAFRAITATEAKPAAGSAIFTQGTPALNKVFNEAFKNVEGDYFTITKRYAENLSLIENPGAHPHYRLKQIVMPSTGNYLEHTARHEFGHHVSRTSNASMRPELAGATDGYSLSSASSFKNAFESDKRALSRLDADTKLALNQVLRSPEWRGEAGLSDLFGSVTLNKIRGVFGHTDSYLKQPGNRQEESIANLFDIYAGKNQRAIEMVEQHLPSMASTFKQMISDIAKRITGT